ncbi:hypothetical protein C7964_102635 [Loktanella sp. PT4BL]|jgi:hypothetical protein|nr:hypothetical protein C7964_102635 [Loktanella sp. PT4BL]
MALALHVDRISIIRDALGKLSESIHSYLAGVAQA